MVASVAEVLRDALALPAEARAGLIDALLESLDSGIQAWAEEAWDAGIHRRLREIDDGAVRMIPWEEARLTSGTGLMEHDFCVFV